MSSACFFKRFWCLGRTLSAFVVSMSVPLLFCRGQDKGRLMMGRQFPYKAVDSVVVYYYQWKRRRRAQLASDALGLETCVLFPFLFAL